MHHLPKIYILFLLVNGFGVNVLSQSLNDTIQIEEIRISSARPLSDNSLTITRIDSAILSNKTTNSLSELLAEHSGIFIKSYGRGAMASASFRGTDPSHTKVLWNGIELNSPMLGMVDFSIIPMFFIDKVELLHGTSSISETPGALGGLINLSTEPEWNNRFSGSYMQGTGSFGSHDEHLRVNAGNSKIQSQTRVFYAHSDNDFKFRNRDIPDSVNLETGQKYFPVMKNENAWFSYYGILQELHFRPAKNDFFSLSFWGQESSRSIPLLSTNETGTSGNTSRQKDNSIRSQFSYRHFGNRYNIKVFSGLNYMNLDYNQKSRFSEDYYLTTEASRSRTSSFYNKLDFQFHFSPDLRAEFSAGGDFHKVETNEIVKNLGYNKSRTQIHVSGAVFKKWNKRLTSNLRTGSEFIQGIKSSPVFHFGTEYHILTDDRLYLKLVLASNTRYPSLNDLYFQPGGNTELKPERSMDQEIGTHYSLEENGLTFSHDLSFYMSQVKNWIMWGYSVKNFLPEPGNIEMVDIKGFDNNTSLAYTGNGFVYKLSAGYTLAQSKDLGRPLNSFDFSNGKQLPYIPVHSGNVMLYLMRNNWSASYIWNYFSERYTTTSNQDSNTRDCLYPYFMNQLGLGKQLNAGVFKLDVNLKIHNLFNEEYRSILQRPMPGRNYSLQFKVCF